MFCWSIILNFTNIFLSGFVSVAYRQNDRYVLVHVSHKKNCTKFCRAGQVLVCSEFILTVISSEMFGGCSQSLFTCQSCESCCVPLIATSLCFSMSVVTCFQPCNSALWPWGYSLLTGKHISHHYSADFQRWRLWNWCIYFLKCWHVTCQTATLCHDPQDHNLNLYDPED